MSKPIPEKNQSAKSDEDISALDCRSVDTVAERVTSLNLEEYVPLARLIEDKTLTIAQFRTTRDGFPATSFATRTANGDL